MNSKIKASGAILLLVLMLAAPIFVVLGTTPVANAEEENPNWVDINKLNNKIFDDEHFQFNPFGVREIRRALDILINRQFLVDNILMGGALPQLTAIRPSHPAYELLGIDDIAAEYGLYPAGDVQTALNMYNNALAKLNDTYHQYGFNLVFKKGEDGKTWLYFVTPDCTEKQVKIYFVIRIEDERKQIGEQIANWIEQYFHIKVERVERERSVVTPIIYGTNPATYGFKTHPWHLYTEGWVSMGDDPTYYARYDAAFFLAPLRGYGPNHRHTNWWYYYNPEGYKLGVDLYYKTYTPEMVDQLWNDTIKMVKIGLHDTIRSWLTNGLEYFMVNNQKVNIPYYGNQSGLWSNWGLRTATSTDGTIVALEFSSTGALFMSAWNPVLGRLGNGIDCAINHVRRQRHFELDLGQQVDGVLGTAIQLGVPLLAAKAAHFGNGHALHANVGECLAHGVELEGLDDGDEHFHGGASFWGRRVASVSKRALRNFCRSHGRGALFLRWPFGDGFFARTPPLFRIHLCSSLWGHLVRRPRHSMHSATAPALLYFGYPYPHLHPRRTGHPWP
jgi:hypothetical protein